MGFNPRACVRRDLQKDARNVIIIKFQSTRLREARLCQTNLINPVFAFQSTRLREARLEVGQSLGQDTKVSIHAPA